MTCIPHAAGSGFVRADPGELQRAAALIRPVQDQVGGLASGVAAAGRQAAEAAGAPEVAAAISALSGALAGALGDTGAVLGHLSEVTGRSSENLGRAGGAS